MYLAYLDDSDTRNKGLEWQVICAVLIPANSFLAMEFMSAITSDDLMPEDRREQFEEFHAAELYGGYGVFEGIDQEARFKAISSLLSGLVSFDFKVAYGAVNLKRLSAGYYGSANPQDVAFRRCVLGVAAWFQSQVFKELEEKRYNGDSTALFIMDEGDSKNRSTLQKTFRLLRGKLRFSESTESTLPFAHDDMYFGDSKYSIGIQIADLCAYFIARHLAGDSEIEHFYKLIDPQIISAEFGE